MLLGPGDYILRADVRTEEVAGLDDTDLGGVGVGISGVPRDQHIRGTVARKPLSHRFQVGEDRKDVVLVLELRGRSGQGLVRHGVTPADPERPRRRKMKAIDDDPDPARRRVVRIVEI